MSCSRKHKDEKEAPLQPEQNIKDIAAMNMEKWLSSRHPLLLAICEGLSKGCTERSKRYAFPREEAREMDSETKVLKVNLIEASLKVVNKCYSKVQTLFVYVFAFLFFVFLAFF